MRADACLHADPTRRQIGESGFHLATRPLLPQHDGTALILANDVERVLADIDADCGGRSVEFLRHGVLLVFGAPCQLSLLAGREHDRTIPLAELAAGPPVLWTAYGPNLTTQCLCSPAGPTERWHRGVHLPWPTAGHRELPRSNGKS